VYRILIAAPPWRGHAQQLLVLGAMLVKRGHSVYFACGQSFESEIVANGMQFCLWSGEKSGAAEEILDRWNNIWGAVSRSTGILEGECAIYTACAEMYQPMFDLFLSIAREIQPHLIVSDRAAIPAADFASYGNIPCVVVGQLLCNFVRPPLKAPQLGTGFLSSMSFLEAIINRTTPMRTLLALWKPILHILRAKRKCCGLRLQPKAPVLVGGYLQFDIPRGLPDHVHVVGPVMPEVLPPLPADIATWLDDERRRPVVLVAFGSLVAITATQVRALLAGFQGDDFDVLWALPQIQHLAEVTTPPNVLVRSFIPQQTVLAHPSIAVFINHGGTNSIIEGLYFAKPMLAIPYFGDHFYNSARLVDSGVGVRMNKRKITSSELHSSICKLLSVPSYRKRACELSLVQRAANGAQRAVEFFEQLLVDKTVFHKKR